MAKLLLKRAVFALLLMSSAFSSVWADPASEFAEANKSYENKDYPDAIGRYQQILDRGIESAPLYFNLGNAYFKSGDLGHAIVNYLRAQRLDPSDDDIRENLEFASSLPAVQMEGVKLNPIRTFLENLLRPYRLNQLAWISSGLFILFFLLLCLRFGLGFRTRSIRWVTTTALVFLVLVAGLTTFKYRNDYLLQRGVLIQDDCQVLTGPSEQSDVELEATSGLIVEILDESGDYYNVLFENSRRGWIRKELVAVV